MKLDMNAKELLALHNLLQARYCVKGSPADLAESDDTNLRQVFNRLRSLLIGSLNGRADDPVEYWFNNQQAKIDALTRKNEEIKRSTFDPAPFTGTKAELTHEVERAQKLASELVEEDYEKELASYPRKAPHPSMPKHNKRHKR